MIVRSGLLLAWLVSGCAEKETPEEDTDVATDTDTEPDTDVVDSDEPEPPAPTITAAFTPATVAPGESAELAVTIENFTVVDPTATPTPKPAEGEGHYHVYYTDADYIAAWTPSITIKTAADDPPGDYVFDIRLVDSSHLDIDPQVSVTVTLTVE